MTTNTERLAELEATVAEHTARLEAAPLLSPPPDTTARPELTAELTAGLEALRVPFPATQVGKLPKAKFKGSPKGLCVESNPATRDRSGAPQDHYCGGWHGLPAVHLDYVGHGAVTDRLLEVDPAWEWEPTAGWAPDGSPIFVRNREGDPVELWIKLTVLGITRPGVGTVAAGHPEAPKILIGDALRNAAMRFGVALDLWIKGHAEDDEQAAEEAPPAPDAAEGRTYGTGRAREPQGEPLAGWESIAQQEGATNALVKMLERLEPAGARAFKEWRKAAGLTIPAPKEGHDAMVAAARNIARGNPPEGHQAAQDAPGSPNGPAGDESDAEGPCSSCGADPCECQPEPELEPGPTAQEAPTPAPDPTYAATGDEADDLEELAAEAKLAELGEEPF